MAELRYNVFTKEWVMMASHRQARPQMPKDWCPFCPSGGKVPEGYTVYRYMNDFPVLSANPPVPDDVATSLFRTAPAYGRCEVVLYAPEHNKTLHELPDAHMHTLAQLWQDVFAELRQDETIKYVYIFENKGDLVGVTMPHPHGQVYAFPYIPKKLETEFAAANEHHQATGNCLFCEALAQEKQDGRRIVFANQHFTVYIPFASTHAYGLHICANRHVADIGALTPDELAALGAAIRDVAGLYDYLFHRPFPYMMCMHNAPVNSGDVSAFHFHVEFYSSLRAADKQQFAASSETGAGAWCNPTAPEQTAQEMREAYRAYLASK